ncbi:MAG: HAD family hydrolase [Spartobacteria bacterium]|nr:HAD family hydrolase [Spartobacteria bacterium]
MIRTGITYNTEITPRTLKGVIFDLDDTLYPYRQFVLSGYQAVAEYLQTVFGVNVEKELVEKYLSGEQNALEGVLRDHFKVVEDSLLQKLSYVFMAHIPQIALYEDARVSMALLIARGKRIGVLADGPLGMQRNKMAVLGLEPLLDCVLYSDELIGGEASWQPCRDPFYIISLQLEIELENMAFVGDNPLVDFVSPNELGMTTIQVVRPDGAHAKDAPLNKHYTADITISSLYDLADVFQEIESPVL